MEVVTTAIVAFCVGGFMATVICAALVTSRDKED